MTKVKAVFFDFYNTLARFWPPVEEIQVASCREIGLSVTREGILKGYHVADDYFNRENARASLSDRPEGDREEFFAQYEQMVLLGAGVAVTLSLARQVWRLTTLVPKEFAAFEDAAPSLRSLKKKGLTLGVISNINRDLEPMLEKMGLAQYLDFWVTSKEVGAEKPHPLVYMAALQKAKVEPGESAHVGDQIYSDVEGARAVGIRPVLIDRHGWHEDMEGVRRVRGLGEVEAVVETGD
jgi:putative hydrolase of the HAD superfamily